MLFTYGVNTIVTGISLKYSDGDISYTEQSTRKTYVGIDAFLKAHLGANDRANVQSMITSRMGFISGGVRAGIPPALTNRALVGGISLIVLASLTAVVAFPVIAVLTTFFATFAMIAAPATAIALIGGIALVKYWCNQRELEAARVDDLVRDALEEHDEYRALRSDLEQFDRLQEREYTVIS